MIVPLVTPLTPDYRVDVPALIDLCRIHIGAGTNVLFVLGTTGEFYGLSPMQRRQVVDVVLEAVGTRVPVIAGVSGESTCAALSALADCRDNRLAGYVLSTPYFLTYVQPELLDHFRVLSDNAGEQPLIVYNYPERYRHTIEIPIVERLLSEKRVLGIKDTAGDFSFFTELLRLKDSYPDFLVFEGALPNLGRSGRFGIDGTVQAIGNLLPHECAALWTCIVEREWSRLEREASRLWSFQQEIESVSSFITSLKACMALRRWCSPTTAQPAAALDQAQLERLRSCMEYAYPASCGNGFETAARVERTVG